MELLGLLEDGRLSSASLLCPTGGYVSNWLPGSVDPDDGAQVNWVAEMEIQSQPQQKG